MKRNSRNHDFERKPVPAQLQKSWLSISSVWIAVGIDLSAMLLGAQLGAGMELKKALLAVLIGSLFLGFLGAFCAYIGAATGLSTAMVSHFAFGKIGAKIISFCLALSLLGWFGVQAGFFAENAHSAIYMLFEMSVSVKILAIIGGLLMMTTAIYGYKAIETLSKLSVPLLVSLIFGAIYIAIKKKGLDVITQTIDTSFTFGTATSLVIGVFVLGTIISPDISRWAKSKRDAVLAAFFGFLIGNSFMLVISIILSKALNTSNLTAIFIMLGLGLPAILVLTLAQWTTNTNNLYSSSLGIAVLFPRISKKLSTFIAGLIATLLAVFGIFDKFVAFLSFITIFIPPVGGIYTAEYYFINKHRFSFNNVYQSAYIVRSLAAWLLASGVAFLTTEAPAGLELLNITSIPALDGFFIALVLQTIFGKIAKKYNLERRLKYEIIDTISN